MQTAKQARKNPQVPFPWSTSPVARLFGRCPFVSLYLSSTTSDMRPDARPAPSLRAPLRLGCSRQPPVCQPPLDPAGGPALNEARSREIPDKGLRNRWPIGSAEIL